MICVRKVFLYFSLPQSETVNKWKWKSLSHVWLFVTPWTIPWNSPGQNTGVGSLSLLQGIFPTQGSNTGLRHCRCILYQLSHNGNQNCQWLLRVYGVNAAIFINNSLSDNWNIKNSWLICPKEQAWGIQLWKSVWATKSHLPEPREFIQYCVIKTVKCHKANSNKTNRWQ